MFMFTFHEQKKEHGHGHGYGHGHLKVWISETVAVKKQIKWGSNKRI
jgi:hypothetical protein